MKIFPFYFFKNEKPSSLQERTRYLSSSSSSSRDMLILLSSDEDMDVPDRK